MADDIDDLLNAVESRFSSKNKNLKTEAAGSQSVTKWTEEHDNEEQCHHYSPLKKENCVTKKSRNAFDLSDILDDSLDDCGSSQQYGLQNSLTDSTQSSLNTSSGKAKCFPVCIGGSTCDKGLSTTVCRRACDRLRCTQCDFLVSSFDNYQWQSNTDYLFLRNNMPEYERVRSKLVHKQGCRAYACQCKWRNAADFVDLQTEADLKWVCGKH